MLLSVPPNTSSAEDLTEVHRNIAFLDILYMVARSLFGSVPFLYTVFDFYHAFTVLAGVIVLALVFSNRIPDSPHWCVSNEQMRKAFESLYHFRESHIIAACDLCHIYFTLDERMSRPDVHSTSLFSMALRSSQYKRAFVVLMGMMLMCNLSAVHLARDQAYFQTIASMGKISLEPSIAMGSFFCMYGILGKIDNFGRRPILIALTLSLIVLMQVPVIVWTMGDAALFMALCSAQWVFVTLYRSLKALYTIYAAEVFSRRYNGIVSPSGARVMLTLQQ